MRSTNQAKAQNIAAALKLAGRPDGVSRAELQRQLGLTRHQVVGLTMTMRNLGLIVATRRDRLGVWCLPGRLEALEADLQERARIIRREREKGYQARDYERRKRKAEAEADAWLNASPCVRVVPASSVRIERPVLSSVFQLGAA